MSETSTTSNSSGGCGCVSIIIFIFVCAALIDSCGVKTPWGTYHLDIFPSPEVRVVEE